MQNRKRIISLGTSILLLLLVATASLPLAAQSKYVVTDLGTLGGPSTSALASITRASGRKLKPGQRHGRAYRTAPNKRSTLPLTSSHVAGRKHSVR